MLVRGGRKGKWDVTRLMEMEFPFRVMEEVWKETMVMFVQFVRKLNAVELYTLKTVNFIVHFTQLLQFFEIK